MKKAITVIDAALVAFQRESGMIPKVVLLPRRLFQQYEFEANQIAAVMPAPDPETHGPEWVDVRVVEHETLTEIEVY